MDLTVIIVVIYLLAGYIIVSYAIDIQPEEKKAIMRRNPWQKIVNTIGVILWPLILTLVILWVLVKRG